MAATNTLVDLLQDSLDLVRVDAPEVWEAVPSLVEYSIANVIPCRSYFTRWASDLLVERPPVVRYVRIGSIQLGATSTKLTSIPSGLATLGSKRYSTLVP